MWFRSDDRGWYHELILGVIWIGAVSEIMHLWTNLKCYVDWKWCGRKFSRPIWSTVWNRSDDRECYHDLILGDM
jgi:hypothetical protein